MPVEDHVGRRRRGEAVPVAAVLHQRHGLLEDLLELPPAVVQARQKVLHRQVQSAAGGIGRLEGFPMRVLQRLLGRLRVGLGMGEDLGADRFVALLKGVVLGVEFRLDVRAGGGIFRLGRRLRVR